jgi:hypothetical protein
LYPVYYNVSKEVTVMRVDITFNEWLKRVEKDMQCISGMGIEEVYKKKWHDWYEDGYSPLQAAETALMNSGFHLEENYYIG